MPPFTRKAFTPYKKFLELSEAALHQVFAYRKVDARRAAAARWTWARQNQRNDVDNFCTAATRKNAHEEDIAARENRFVRLDRRYQELLNIAVADRTSEDVRLLLVQWGAKYECKKGITEVYVLLERQSQDMTNALQAIWSEQSEQPIQVYFQQKHQDVRNAEARAHNHWNQINNDIANLGIIRTNNGELKIPQHWLPAFKKREKDDRVESAFVSPPGNATPGWHGCWPVAEQGGFSFTGIWVKVDQDGRIVDRLLRKDVKAPAENWADITRFEYPSDGMRDNRDGIVPLEVVCIRDLSAIPSTKFGQGVDVVGLRNCIIDPDNYKYRLYFDYCGFGDLDSLIQRYNRSPAFTRLPPTQKIPEPFLWRVFLALAVVGLAMQNGQVTSNLKDEQWEKEIVHRDLKPGNVFLDAPVTNGGHFETYPTVRLGDFGSAVKTHGDDLLNPTIFLRFDGTPSWAAPEQTAYADLQNCEPVHRHKLLAWTNVYSIGMTMLSLMTLVELPKLQYAWGDNRSGHNLRRAPYNDKVAGYSNRLLDLVQECLEFNPANRLSFVDIVARIQQAVALYGRDNGRKTAIPGDPTLLNEDELVRSKDEYVRTFALRNMPEPNDLR